jgi:hypothetical protein
MQLESFEEGGEFGAHIVAVEGVVRSRVHILEAQRD